MLRYYIPRNNSKGTEGAAGGEESETINDWGARTRQGTVRNHSAAAGAAIAEAVRSAQLVRYTLQQVGKVVGNCIVQVVPVVVSGLLVELKGTVQVQHPRNLIRDPQKRSKGAEVPQLL